jgi:hypothetical protein
MRFDWWGIPVLNVFVFMRIIEFSISLLHVCCHLIPRDVYHEHVKGINNVYFCGMHVFSALSSDPTHEIRKRNNLDVLSK